MKLNIEALVQIITGANIDITKNFNDWTKVAFAIASEYGEEGRSYFHKLARLAPNYRKGENDNKYDNALKTGKKVNISTLIYIAKKNGIDVSSAYIKDIVDIDQSYVFVSPINHDSFNDDEFKGMPIAWVDASNKLVSQSSLYSGLSNLSFLKKKSIVGDIFDEYEVGALNDGCTTIFWQIDLNGRIRNGKTIPYKDDLHRDKTKGANWIHSLKKMENYKYKQCLFGEHLFKEKYKDVPMVFVVESEKTALICNIIYRNNPNFVWLASGGYQNLTDSTMCDLKDKYIKLFADKDAQSAWETKKLQLTNKGYYIEMIDWQSMFPSDTLINPKDDIADVILRASRNELISLREKLSEISCLS